MTCKVTFENLLEVLEPQTHQTQSSTKSILLWWKTKKLLTVGKLAVLNSVSCKARYTLISVHLFKICGLFFFTLQNLAVYFTHMDHFYYYFF